MRTVYKYSFPITDLVELEMPLGAQVVHIEEQRGACLWALVDPEQPRELRHFHIYGTGRPIHRSALSHVGTFLMAGGTLVWHVFEMRKEPK